LITGAPVARRKIAAVQQHHDAAVRLVGRDVHVGHPKLLAVIDQRQQVDGVGIGEAFEIDAVRLARRLRCNSGCKRNEKGSADRAEDDAVHESGSMAASWCPRWSRACASFDPGRNKGCRGRVKLDDDKPL